MERLFVREMKVDEIPLLVDYFLSGDIEFYNRLGIDINKLPEREEWIDSLEKKFIPLLLKKEVFYVVWILDEVPIGHCNINDIVFGEKANMHLHLWKTDTRKKGLGTKFVELSLKEYFKRFELKHIFCEPNALNEASNNTLRKVGFEFVKEYESIPSAITSLQRVNQWIMPREKMMEN